MPSRRRRPRRSASGTSSTDTHATLVLRAELSPRRRTRSFSEALHIDVVVGIAVTGQAIQLDHVGGDRARRLVVHNPGGSERRRTQSLRIGTGVGAVTGNGGSFQPLLPAQACKIVDD